MIDRFIVRSAGDRVKPGVERSGTPGPRFFDFRAREAGESANEH